MKLDQVFEALKAVRDVDTNHRGELQGPSAAQLLLLLPLLLLLLRHQLHYAAYSCRIISRETTFASADVTAAGLQGLRRELLRSRPAADQLLADFFTTSPSCHELHAIWEVQVSAKDLIVALELCSLCTTILRYRPSPSCSSTLRQQILHAQDHLASSLIQRRLKAVYFHLSSSNRPRSNAALALLTAISNRGGSVLRELVSAFDFSLAVLPKLARPPKTAAAATADGGSIDGTSDAVTAAEGGVQPGHWLTWNSPQLSKRPSRAMFVGWGECDSRGKAQEGTSTWC
jgi:hypothetical protein